MERIYLDTSVFGGYFEPEFERWTKILFDKIREGQYRLLYSRLTDNELIPAPENIKDLVLQIPDDYIEVIEITREVTELAESGWKDESS